MSLETARRVLRIEAAAIEDLIKRLDASFERAVDLLFACKGRVAVTGMGKSGLIGRKIAATFSSTGTPSFFLHPADALHGDLGMLASGDVVLALSYGGETEEIVALLPTLQRLGIAILAMTGQPRSSLATASAVVLDVSVKEEACSLNLAPTASTTAALALGDALAVSLLDRRGFDTADFAALHPSGRLGKKLMRVEALMHSGEAMPRVAPGARMPDIIYEMSQKGLGHDDGRGRIRSPRGNRNGRRPAPLDANSRWRNNRADGGASDDAPARHDRPARTCEYRAQPDGAAQNHAVVVVDEGQHVCGVLHLHDLWTLELY